MSVFRDLRMAFAHVPKTGGTSVERALGLSPTTDRRFGPGAFVGGDVHNRYASHYALHETLETRPKAALTKTPCCEISTRAWCHCGLGEAPRSHRVGPEEGTALLTVADCLTSGRWRPPFY